MNRTWANVVRFAVAALLGLAACLVAWWPQSASGSGDVADLSPAAALPTQMTPTAAPPPAPPPTQAPPPQPTKKPTKKPQHSSGGSNHHPTTLHNSGNHSSGNHNSGSQPSGHQSTSSGHTSTGSSSSGSGSTPYVAPTPHSTPPPAAPTKPATSAPTKAATTTAPTPTRSTEAAAPETTAVDDPSDSAAGEYDTYLSSSEPVQATSAPVWVVPGILLVLTSMLALLGGVLGRGNRPMLARVRSASRNDERPTPPPAPQPPSMFKPAPGPETE